MTLSDSIPAVDAAPVATTAPEAWSPQFSNAQYGRTTEKRCNLCSHHLFTYYFRANGRKICDHCAEQIRMGDSSASRAPFFLPLLAGILGAAAATVAYAAMIWGTGSLGVYCAVFVGWIVGRFVMSATNGVSNFSTQAIAAIFTYVAICLQDIPRLFWNAHNDPNVFVNWNVVLPRAVVAGLTSPFTRFDANSASSILDLVFIFLSVMVAMRLTRYRPLAVAGPFDVATA